MSTLSLFDIIESPPIPRARRTDPETSHIAAELAKVSASKHRMLCLRELAKSPATDFELAERTGVQQTSIGKRRGELRDLGYVEALAGERRRTPSGALAQVWRATPAGKRRLDGQAAR